MVFPKGQASAGILRIGLLLASGAFLLILGRTKSWLQQNIRIPLKTVLDLKVVR